MLLNIMYIFHQFVIGKVRFVLTLSDRLFLFSASK